MDIKKIIAGLLCTAILSVTAFASKPSAPVNWHISLAMGEIIIHNGTIKNEVVHVSVNSGTVGVFKIKNNELNCAEGLGDYRQRRTIICELEPGEDFHIDLDYEFMKDAYGTYQIEVEG